MNRQNKASIFTDKLIEHFLIVDFFARLILSKFDFLNVDWQFLDLAQTPVWIGSPKRLSTL